MNFIDQKRADQIIPEGVFRKIIDYIVLLGSGEKVEIEKSSSMELRIKDTIIYLDDRNLRYYQVYFESHLIEQTERYYSEQLKAWKDVSVREQTRLIKSVLESEEAFSAEFIPHSQNIYISTIQKILIEMNAQNLVKNQVSGLRYMILNQSEEDITVLYNLLKIRPESLVHLGQEL